jgi:hypothetical protein
MYCILDLSSKSLGGIYQEQQKEVLKMKLIKILNDYAAIRVLEINEKNIIWQFVTGGKEADKPIKSKRINKPLGTYFIRHDSMYRIEDFEAEITEFIPKA